MNPFETLRAAILHRIKRHSRTPTATAPRPYAFGDDVRCIDWNATARTGELHARRRFHERSVTFATITGRAGAQSESAREVSRLWHRLAHPNDRYMHIADDDVTGALRSAIATTRSDTAFLVISETHAISAKRRIHWVLLALFLAGMLLLVTSCGHPRIPMPSERSGLTVAICIDTSGSMASSDISPTRARAAITAIREFFLQLSQDTSIELIAFASDAEIVQPFTADRVKLEDALSHIPPPNGATAIGDAFAAARETFIGTPGIVVLLTDGVNNRGRDPLVEARALASHGARIFTIGIGKGTGDIMPGTSERATIDPDVLRTYARVGHGMYYQAASRDMMRSILSNLGRTIVYVPKELDLSYTFAILGAMLAISAAVGVAAGGRIP